MNLVRLPRVIQPFARGPKLYHLLTNCTLLSSYNIIYSAFKYPSQNHCGPSNKLKHVTFVHTHNSDPLATNGSLPLIAFYLDNITGTFGCSVTLSSPMLLPIKPPAIIVGKAARHVDFFCFIKERRLRMMFSLTDG